MIGIAPSDWVTRKIPLTQPLPPNHISFLIYFPYWLLGLEKILPAATAVNSFDRRPFLLSEHLDEYVSMFTEGNLSLCIIIL